MCQITFKCCEHVLDTVYSHALCKPCIRPALGMLYVRLQLAMGVLTLRPGYALSTATVPFNDLSNQAYNHQFQIILN